MTSRSQRVLPPDVSREALPLDRLLLEGRKAKLVLGARLTGAYRAPSILGASAIVLEVWDGDRRILSSGALGKRVMSGQAVIEIDGLSYTASDRSRSGSTLTIRFEWSGVTKLRHHGIGKPLRMSRNDITRASFCARMIRQAGVPVIVLDEHLVQPLAAALKSTKTTTTSRRPAGLTGDLKVKGSAATAEQRRNMATVMAAALAENPSPRALLALIEACIVENEFHNTQGKGADAISFGILQNIPGTSNAVNGTITEAQAKDIAYTVKSALLPPGPTSKGGLIKVARQNPGWTPGQIAAYVINGGGDPQYATKCNSYRAEAEQIIKAAGGTVDSTVNLASTVTYFERTKTESTWKAAGRLLEEVRWRLFDREGVVIIASDPALMRSSPAIVIDAAGDYVQDGIDFSDHRALAVTEAHTRILASRYTVDPGEVAQLTGQSQTDEDWLIQDAQIPLMGPDPFIDVSLIQPQAALPEPADQAATTSTIDAGSGPTKVQRFFTVCKRISDQKLPYVWGGGHAHAGTPDGGTGNGGVGYDCSGSCGAALALADLGFTKGQAIPGSEDFATGWGSAGRGKYFTVWANKVHVFIEFHGDLNGWQFNTAGHNDDRGPRLLKQSYGHDGFTARHYPGL